jgi:excinuclease ABC subunit C
MEMSNVADKIAKLPPNPGIYTFLDDKKKILYIGKATNLKNRVNSYFQGRNERGMRIVSMVAQIADIKIQETDSVLEALILESNLIKKFQPKYNVERKDDKSFSYAVITKEEFPRVLIFRKIEIDFEELKAKSYKLKAIFGPYTSKKQLEIALKIIRKIFPYHSNKQKTEKGCLDFQLGRCSGPYAGAISKADYAKNIRGIKMILKDKKKSLLKRMEKEMQSLSNHRQYEQAADIRNKIFALKHIQDVALISEPESKLKAKSYKLKANRIEAYDISNISGQYAVGSMVVFSDGEPDKSQYRKFKIKTIKGSNDVGMMAEVLFRRFRHPEWPKPDLILLDGGKGQLSMGERVLKELKLKVPMVAVTKGKDRKIFNFQFSIFNEFSMTKFSNEILKDTNLIKRIMDEAHRFAISYHKKLRKKNFLVN